MVHTLQTKCIRDKPEETDGIRVSVMRLHTLDDGVTPDPTIDQRKIDVWLPHLGPSLKLAGDYLVRKEIGWDTYVKIYNQRIRSNEPKIVKSIRLLDTLLFIDNTPATILCEEKYHKSAPLNELKCHRRLLAEYYQERFPSLDVLHL